MKSGVSNNKSLTSIEVKGLAPTGTTVPNGPIPPVPILACLGSNDNINAVFLMYFIDFDLVIC